MVLQLPHAGVLTWPLMILLKMLHSVLKLVSVVLLISVLKRFVPWLGTFPQVKLAPRMTRDDLVVSSSWSNPSPSPPYIRDIHVKFLVDFDCTDSGDSWWPTRHDTSVGRGNPGGVAGHQPSNSWGPVTSFHSSSGSSLFSTQDLWPSPITMST